MNHKNYIFVIQNIRSNVYVDMLITAFAITAFNFQVRMTGERGSGAGKGGGGGGSIREAGGSFGKMEAAHEDQYFYNQLMEEGHDARKTNGIAQTITSKGSVTRTKTKINKVQTFTHCRANGVDGNDHPTVSPNHYSEDCSSPAGTGSSTGDVATTLYQCGVCELLFEQEIELLRHLKGAHKSPANLEYQCTLCLRKFLSKVRLVRHLANHRHNNDLVNPESIAAERHRIPENSGHHYKCELCQKILSSRLNMIRHLRMHKDERLSVCHVCGKSFRSDGDVKRHINDVHLKLKRHSCEYCGRAFAAKATKDAHQRIHTGEKPFLCSQCPKRFRSINLLGVHKKVHENHRPFGCAYCPKTFRSKQKVQVHESVHTGYKPFECDVCGSAFSSKGECTRHSITHSSERPFECSLCDKSFKLNKYLRGHLRKCHPKEAPDILYQMDN
ncbi:unnamed protein product [Trichogramma brassicae]|uniref:C2H2-type domain-containing protein n=1 Tax=Trichogramma brassicae TaxID=86971 RepID=A0A6H5ILV8_9HYME|nr:unnamed protein product [Trichogramma brassicae]